jgi:hypothetical protein
MPLRYGQNDILVPRIGFLAETGSVPISACSVLKALCRIGQKSTNSRFNRRSSVFTTWRQEIMVQEGLDGGESSRPITSHDTGCRLVCGTEYAVCGEVDLVCGRRACFLCSLKIVQIFLLF